MFLATEGLNVMDALTAASGINFSISAGNLTVRLAASTEEITAAQSLRYPVFYEEMNATPSLGMQFLLSDFDSFDEICDHLLVICEDRADLPCGVIGTYRTLRRRVAMQSGGFYLSDEFDLIPLLDLEGEIMALGRSCVDPEHRNRPTMRLLWQAIAPYVQRYKIDVLLGWASIIRTEIEKIKLPPSYVYHYYLVPEKLRPQAIDCRSAGKKITAFD